LKSTHLIRSFFRVCSDGSAALPALTAPAGSVASRLWIPMRARRQIRFGQKQRGQEQTNEAYGFFRCRKAQVVTSF
jgi:hypothetical protein